MRIEAGDLVEVYCPQISSMKNTHIVKEVDGEWCVFDESIGKIQLEYCTKIEK